MHLFVNYSNRRSVTGTYLGAGENVFPIQVTNGLVKKRKRFLQRNYDSSKRSLVDVTVSILRVRLRFQYDRWLVQIILSKYGTVLQVNKIRYVEVGQKGTLSACHVLF